MRAAARATKWSSPAAPAAAFSAASATSVASGVPATASVIAVTALGLRGLRAEQSGDEDPVEGVHGRECLVEPVHRVGEQIRTHQATALVGGNHCISGNGTVTGSRSR